MSSTLVSLPIRAVVDSRVNETPVNRGQCSFEVGQDVGWDQRRFAAPAHHDFSTFFGGGPALEASWSHPTLKQAMALDVRDQRFSVGEADDTISPASPL